VAQAARRSETWQRRSVAPDVRADHAHRRHLHRAGPRGRPVLTGPTGAALAWRAVGLAA